MRRQVIGRPLAHSWSTSRGGVALPISPRGRNRRSARHRAPAWPGRWSHHRLVHTPHDRFRAPILVRCRADEWKSRRTVRAHSGRRPPVSKCAPHSVRPQAPAPEEVEQQCRRFGPDDRVGSERRALTGLVASAPSVKVHCMRRINVPRSAHGLGKLPSVNQPLNYCDPTQRA